MSFKFDYKEKNWKKRKELVEEYEAEHTMIYDIHELTIKNTKEIKNKNGDVIGYKLESCQELKSLFNELIRMYDYIVYAKDKSIKKYERENNTSDKKHMKLIIDNEQGVKSYYSPKRGNDYKEINYYDGEINHRKYVLNNLKRYAENRELIDVITQQQADYRSLIDKTKVKDSQWFNERYLRKQNTLTSLYNDIRDCERGIENISKVNVKEGIRMRHDVLKDVDIKYDEKVIECVLKNWNEMKEQSHRKVGSTLHAIYMDVEDALKITKLTDKQLNALSKVFNKETLNCKEHDLFNRVVKKIVSTLNEKK